jgi:hypothetical protein
MDDSISLLLYLVIAAIVGIVTLVKKVMEKATSGEDGKKIDLAKVVQEQMQRYLKGGPPGRMGGRGFMGKEDEPPTDARPPLVPAAVLTKPVRPQQEQVRRKPPPPPQRPVLQTRELVPLRVKPAIDKNRSLVSQAGAVKTVLRRETRHRPGKLPLSRKNLRKAVLLAEILGPPVSERKDYRLF